MNKDTAQPDLFAAPAPARTDACDAPPDFVEDRRRELLAMLDRVRKASRLPWPDQAQAWVPEMRFDGLLVWLPKEEAAALKGRFDTELDRLYAAEAGPRAPV